MGQARLGFRPFIASIWHKALNSWTVNRKNRVGQSILSLLKYKIICSRASGGEFMRLFKLTAVILCVAILCGCGAGTSIFSDTAAYPVSSEIFAQGKTLPLRECWELSIKSESNLKYVDFNELPANLEEGRAALLNSDAALMIADGKAWMSPGVLGALTAQEFLRRMPKTLLNGQPGIEYPDYKFHIAPVKKSVAGIEQAEFGDAVLSLPLSFDIANAEQIAKIAEISPTVYVGDALLCVKGEWYSIPETCALLLDKFYLSWNIATIASGNKAEMYSATPFPETEGYDTIVIDLHQKTYVFDSQTLVPALSQGLDQILMGALSEEEIEARFDQLADAAYMRMRIGFFQKSEINGLSDEQLLELMDEKSYIYYGGRNMLKALDGQYYQAEPFTLCNFFLTLMDSCLALEAQEGRVILNPEYYPEQ